VNDERGEHPGATVTAVLTGPLGTRTWRWTGDVAADDVTFIGELAWIAPTATGPLQLDLTLETADRRVTNRSRGLVVAPRQSWG
jgi:hypothetical protein